MLIGIQNAVMIHNPLAGSGRGPRARQLDAARRILARAGADGVMVHSLDLELKRRMGIVAYWVEGFRQLFRYTFPRFRLSTAGFEMQATLVVVGRTKHYGGPFRITTEADLFKDEFELAAYTTRSPARYLSYLPAAWLGQLRRISGVPFIKMAGVAFGALYP